MNCLSTIQKQDLIPQSGPRASYTPRPNGDVLIAWHPTGARRRSTTLTGLEAAEFADAIATGTTKNGKVPQRLIDALVGERLAPAPTYHFARVLNGTRIDITRRAEGQAPKVRTLSARKSTAFLKDLEGINVRGTKKQAEAESRLAATYF